ncbi:unnamed protein product [Meloidogyne enterolobii]|uniref:Uncharacterized protein n=1 Tax=Meloidogyne enterolobii TaxID=390850 RepID=A0ACB0XXP5_MELEN
MGQKCGFIREKKFFTYVCVCLKKMCVLNPFQSPLLLYIFSVLFLYYLHILHFKYKNFLAIP